MSNVSPPQAFHFPCGLRLDGYDTWMFSVLWHGDWLCLIMSYLYIVTVGYRYVRYKGNFINEQLEEVEKNMSKEICQDCESGMDAYLVCHSSHTYNYHD